MWSRCDFVTKQKSQRSFRPCQQPATCQQMAKLLGPNCFPCQETGKFLLGTSKYQAPFCIQFCLPKVYFLTYSALASPGKKLSRRLCRPLLCFALKGKAFYNATHLFHPPHPTFVLYWVFFFPHMWIMQEGNPDFTE